MKKDKNGFTYNIAGYNYSFVDIMIIFILSVLWALLIKENVSTNELIVVFTAIVIITLQINSSYIYLSGLFGLISIILLRVIAQDQLAETVADYVFYILVIGVIAALLEEQSSRYVSRLNNKDRTNIEILNQSTVFTSEPGSTMENGITTTLLAINRKLKSQKPSSFTDRQRIPKKPSSNATHKITVVDSTPTLKLKHSTGQVGTLRVAYRTSPITPRRAVKPKNIDGIKSS